eukprot:scaffold7730_cov71-Cylindrotheca_fusiformis.AAC.1
MATQETSNCMPIGLMMFHFSILFGRRKQQLSSDRIQHEQTTSSANRRTATPNVYNYYVAVNLMERPLDFAIYVSSSVD